jgi:peroxiredoxin/outer membrane lipoprotein-sorting protein
MLRREEPASGISGSWRLRIEGRTEAVEDVGAHEFVVVSDGQRYSWIDDSRRQLIYRPHSASRGQPTDTASMIQIPHIGETAPMQRDLASQTIALEEPLTLDGVVCDVVFVDPGETLPKMRWAIAREDGVPRRAERLIQGGILDDRQVWTITNVKIDGELSEDLFTLTAPEGYVTVGAPMAARPTTPTPAGQDTDEVMRSPIAPAARTVGTDVGNLAPDFELPTPDGGSVRLSSLRGDVVLLDFWGTWCIPCRRSSPEVQKVHDEYKDRGVKVLGLAVREANDQNPANYMRDHNYTYQLLLRADDVARQYRVRAYPSFVVIGREGEIVHYEASFDGEGTFPRIRGAIDRALAGPAQIVPDKPAQGEDAEREQAAEEGAARGDDR